MLHYFRLYRFFRIWLIRFGGRLFNVSVFEIVENLLDEEEEKLEKENKSLAEKIKEK